MAKVMNNMAVVIWSSMEKMIQLSTLIDEHVKGVSVSKNFTELGTMQEQI